MSNSSVRVAVVGGGIIGLSTGIRILQEFPKAEVTIYTESVTPNTTGDVAAGFWTPIYLSDTPSRISDPWAAQTFQYLKEYLEKSLKPMDTGVFYCPGYLVHRTADAPVPSWSNVPIGFRRMSQSELSMFSSDIKSGYFYVTLMAEGRKFIPRLMEMFFQLGGRVNVNCKVKSFNELQSQGYRYIVNCSGIGARELCKDDKVVPIRGHVLRVSAPWMNFWMADDRGAYCLPNSDTVVIGGVTQRGSWSLQASDADRRDILSRVYALWPQLKSAKIVAESVGLRPGRETVRLERETMPHGCTVYHNYGHGGAGLSLFWGCACDIVKLLKEDVQIAAVDSKL